MVNTRPMCVMCSTRPGWISMFGQWVCGECVAKWNSKKNEATLEDMKAVLNGN